MHGYLTNLLDWVLLIEYLTDMNMKLVDFEKHNILIITGDSGSGKSTVADYLDGHERFGHLVSVVSFGHYLRGIVDQWMREKGETVPWDLTRQNRANRDVWERESGYKDTMIRWGDQVIARHPQAFINPAIAEILETPTSRLIVVPDCRSPMELYALKSVGNVWGVRLVRDGVQVKKYDGMLKYLNLPLVDNNGDLDSTVTKIAGVLRMMPNT